MAPKILAIVLAGGEGKRLMPLTMDRAKPAVPFGGHFRLIDFALSNIVNSGFLKIIVLTQYKSHSLDRHIAKTWRLSTTLGNYVAPVPAQQRTGKHWYMGSADAIYQSLNIVQDEQPDYLVIIGADNIYRMDFSQMLEHHISTGAGCTVAGIRQPIELASSFGVIESQGSEIKAFREKPEHTEGLPDAPNQILASMGNYIFTREALVDALRADADSEESKHDMGGDIVPYFVSRNDASVYDFKNNQVPGASDRDRDYWRDVGTVDSYYSANMDLISIHPVFNLYNASWPTLSSLDGWLPPAKFVYADDDRRGQAIDSFVSPGVIVSGGEALRSILSPGVRLNSYSHVSDSVLMDHVQVGRHAQISKAILDKNVIVEEGALVGIDLQHDLDRGFTVTDSGITVVPKGSIVTK